MDKGLAMARIERRPHARRNGFGSAAYVAQAANEDVTERFAVAIETAHGNLSALPELS